MLIKYYSCIKGNDIIRAPLTLLKATNLAAAKREATRKEKCGDLHHFICVYEKHEEDAPPEIVSKRPVTRGGKWVDFDHF